MRYLFCGNSPFRTFDNLLFSGFSVSKPGSTEVYVMSFKVKSMLHKFGYLTSTSCVHCMYKERVQIANVSSSNIHNLYQYCASNNLDTAQNFSLNLL